MPERPPAGTDRTVGLLLAAAAVVVATVLLVATLGLSEPPPLDPVDASTRPDRALAVLTWRDEGGQCVIVVAPDGTAREVRCGLDAAGPLLGWDDAGIVVLRYVAGTEQRETLDPVTGTTVARAALAGGGTPVPALRLPAGTERRDGELIVRDADGREVWRVDAPESYAIQGSAFAVDGTLALLDSAGRLLVLSPGAAAPRIWVADLDVTWGELVWEGTPPVRE